MESTALVAQPSQAPATGQEEAYGDEDLSRLRRLFRAFESNKKREVDEAKESRRYYSGRQWTDAELAILKRRNQPAIWDNRIARKVDFLVGVEQRMRRDPKAFGRGPSDQKSADVSTASLRYVCDQGRWEVIASDAAHDGMVSGVGVAWIGIEKGPKGLEVKIKRGQTDRFFYDPRATMPDLSDARYMGMYLWLDVEDVKAEYPDLAEKLEGLFDRDGGLALSALDEDREMQWADFEQKRVRVVEFYERKPTEVGPAWHFCKFTGSLVLEEMWSPYRDENGIPDCPYVAWSPYIDERGDRYGVVRNMRPMQDEVNQRRSKLLHLTNVSRLHMRDGVVDDEDKVRNELAKPDGIVKHQGTWGQDIGIIEQASEIKGQAELLMQAQSSLENLGPNPGLIGKGGGVADQSGRAILAQRDSGMTELSPVFERLRDWKLRCYRKMWFRVRQAWTGERYIRITEDPKAPQYIGLNRYQSDPMTGQATSQNVLAEIDVDIILDEGPDTIVMQEELMQTLSQLGEAATGPLGRVLIELSQVSNKDHLLQIMDKAMAPDPAMGELKQRMAALELVLKQAQVAKTHAETEEKRINSAIAMAQSAVPPQVVAQTYPIPFRDAMPQGSTGPGPGQAPQMGGPGGPPQPPPQPPMMMPGQPMPGGPPQGMPPEQMAAAGGLPISPEVSGQMSAGPQGA